MKKRILFTFIILTLPFHTFSVTIDDIYENMLNICLEDLPEEYCICSTSLFRVMLLEATLTDEELETFIAIQNGTHDLADFKEIEEKLNFKKFKNRQEACAIKLDGIDEE